MFSRFKILFLVTGIVSSLWAQGDHNWTTCWGFSDNQMDGFIFNNNRWGGETGCMFAKTGGPELSWWTTHTGKSNPDWPVSQPHIGMGNSHGRMSPNAPLPAKISDIEYMYVSWVFQVPPHKEHHKWKAYLQTWVGSSPGKNYSHADFSPSVYFKNCPECWWGKEVDVIQAGDYSWKICDCHGMSYQSDNYWVPVMSPQPEPDENGIIRLYNMDFKALLDYHVQKGYINGNYYLQVIQPGWEIYVMDDVLKTIDIGIRIKVKGQNEVLIPSYSTIHQNDAVHTQVLQESRMSAPQRLSPLPVSGVGGTSLFTITGRQVSSPEITGSTKSHGVYISPNGNLSGQRFRTMVR